MGNLTLIYEELLVEVSKYCFTKREFEELYGNKSRYKESAFFFKLSNPVGKSIRKVIDNNKSDEIEIGIKFQNSCVIRFRFGIVSLIAPFLIDAACEQLGLNELRRHFNLRSQPIIGFNDGPIKYVITITSKHLNIEIMVHQT